MDGMDPVGELRALLPNCMRQEQVRIQKRLDELLTRRRPAGDQEFQRLLRAAQASAMLRHRRYERVPQVTYPPALPISSRKDEIIAAIRAHPVVIVAGETGSGKTTQIPKMCLEAGYGIDAKIGCTQPRRVAAVSISRRIADELGVTWGGQVGYKVRFSDASSPESYVKVMTDGMLLAELRSDPELTEYEVIVVDEAHERSLNIDFLLGHLKGLVQRRLDLKVVITSATIDTESFSRAFSGAPVIEVSGRLYPVEMRYAPIDPEDEETGEMTYVEAAVRAVESLVGELGDILIFMPSERDIREAQDDLVGRYGQSAEILPLFGRLTAAEQERVFAPTSRRKIIISTNLAETSLTIPGIRFVIDTGLGRISRYNPRTRTKRLPIEGISQSSANQRAGRSGRLQNGVCIRLYSEEEFLERPRFSQPEIQRSNLAEVILRMKAFGLGEVETFPFLDPPNPQAIRNGYQLLQELGALDAERNLTVFGRDLARLPVDPAIGRMVLQSTLEDALEDVLVIAAGLSIQDPRERPLDREEAADFAHRQFAHPESDFLTLLNIWNAYHDRWEALKTQGQMRKFCRSNFLSYQRMREWRDVHVQLRESLQEVMKLDRGGVQPRLRADSVRETERQLRGPGDRSRKPAPGIAQAIPSTNDLSYAAIHRSILAGLLGHVAQRTERNVYRAAGGREVTVFPGSNLADKGQGGRVRKTAAGSQSSTAIRQPEWIMAGELVETSRLYARTLARIEPEWIVDLGAHLCKRSYSDPHWNSKAGRVLVRERTALFGLVVDERWVDYGKVQPKEATELFIRSALIEEPIPAGHAFLHHNQELVQRIEVYRTRTRDRSFPDLNEALFSFYAARIDGVSSIADLNRLIRERIAREPRFLFATEADLVGHRDVSFNQAAFPSEIAVAGESAAVRYAYAPGEVQDGATVQLSPGLAQAIEPDAVSWAIPGFREEQLDYLLKALPKALRVQLMPIAPKVKELAAALQPGGGLRQLRQLIREKYRVDVPEEQWNWERVPEYLRPQIAVIGANRKPIVAGRDLAAIKRQIQQHETPAEQEAWTRAATQWERYQLTGWNFGDLPERIEISHDTGQPLYAFPGLQVDEHGIHLRLFRNRTEAEQATRVGFVRLVELALQREFAWAATDLRKLEQFKNLYVTLGPADELLETAMANVRAFVLQPPAVLLPLEQRRFDDAVRVARERIQGPAAKLAEHVPVILQLRQQLLLCKKPYPAMRQDLDTLLPRRFLERIPFQRLPHVPRYLKAMAIRAERAALNPLKDQERTRFIQPYAAALQQLTAAAAKDPGLRESVAEFRWALEEFKVSVFAQELGTAEPISAKRLDQRLAAIRERFP